MRLRRTQCIYGVGVLLVSGCIYFSHKLAFVADTPIAVNAQIEKTFEVQKQIVPNKENIVQCSQEPQRLQGMMTQAEITFLKSFIKSDVTYFEWGSGGSTDTFGRLTSGKIVSVENYQPWCDKVLQLPFVQCRQKFTSLDYKCIIPYPTSSAGYPVDKAHNGDFDTYIEVIKDYSNFDIVLVDGRWRVACALFALDHIKDETVLFIHDFSDRPEYHAVFEWYDEVEHVDRLVALKRKKGVARPSTNIMQQYKMTPGR